MLLLAACAIFLVFIPLTARAQVSARAEINPQSGAMNSLFLFTVTFEGAPRGISPQVQTSSDFEVQFLGPRSLTMIINGETRSQQSFVYQLIPKREGQLQTPQVAVTLDGREIVANSLPVVVEAGKAASEPEPGKPGESKLFMNQTASPNSVFVGQQIMNALTLYTQVNVPDVSLDKSETDGFWQEVLPNSSPTKKTIQDQTYTAVELSRALFPLRTGDLTIPQRRAVAKVEVLSSFDPFRGLNPLRNDIFQGFFQTRELREVPLVSNEVSVTVEPLPPSPVDLAPTLGSVPIVGATSISTTYSDAVMNAGESKLISITVSSEGNLNPLRPITLTPPAHLKLYDGQNETKHTIKAGRLITQKTFTITAVPLYGGAVRIAGPSLTFFDPTLREYKKTSTGDITFLVAGASAPPEAAQQSIETPPPAIIDQEQSSSIPDVLPYTERTLYQSLAQTVSPQLGALVALAVVCLLTVSSIAIRRRRAGSPLRSLSSELAAVEEIADLEAIVRLWIATRLRGASNSSTFDELRALVRSSLTNKEAAVSLCSVLDDIELHRYSDGSHTSLAQLKERFYRAAATLSR